MAVVNAIQSAMECRFPPSPSSSSRHSPSPSSSSRHPPPPVELAGGRVGARLITNSTGMLRLERTGQPTNFSRIWFALMGLRTGLDSTGGWVWVRTGPDRGTAGPIFRIW
eukprot:GHVU01231622.1.p2 GENE.GHVU01231622.1~~GHVU01231622.1.p2  ORF type:complete len:110 (-),score=9.56 GHVU01231622.1:229-558(-)